MRLLLSPRYATLEEEGYGEGCLLAMVEEAMQALPASELQKCVPGSQSGSDWDSPCSHNANMEISLTEPI